MSDYKVYKVTLWDDVLQKMFSIDTIAIDEHEVHVELGQHYKDFYIIKIEEHNE